MAINETSWGKARRIVRLGTQGARRCSIRTRDPQHGVAEFEVDSLLLDRRPGFGAYFITVGTADLSRSLDERRSFQLVATSTRRPGLHRLSSGLFGSPSSVVMTGMAGPRRQATPDETQKWRAYADDSATRNRLAMRGTTSLYVRELRFQTASLLTEEDTESTSFESADRYRPISLLASR